MQRAKNRSIGLGWFSIGLGLTELLAAKQVCKFLGVEESNKRLVRGLGVRELVSGTGILRGRRHNPWLKSRVWGDAMDLMLLAAALRASSSKLRAVTAIAAVTGVTALDVRKARATRGEQSMQPDVTIIVNRSVEEVRELWRNLGDTSSVTIQAAPGWRGSILSSSDQSSRERLRRFKRLAEVGEVVTTKGQPAGRSTSLSPKYDRLVA